ncbi:hypothetical protein MMUR_47970 [Mycolicibacterium murale]|uniref:Diphosphate--fructose-6-phosphate 1-phosphotransferase n=2 Tax=Mycolicibacterium murale TaxID=182220 RepID=A0A7I9WSE6_9MYCO|nr:hypothetical protein MMUR_47970 [Mycolicibacterium murale]
MSPWRRGPGDEVWTYRYLRIGLVGAVVFLAVSVAITTATTGRWQPSISAYFYTTSHAALTGALCAVGLGLIAYKGSTATEDVLLNSAGFLAFIVALVPTARPPCAGTPASCGLWLPELGNATAAVPNNLTALAAATAVGIAFYAAVRGIDPAPQPRWPAPHPAQGWVWLARAAQAVLVLAGLGVLWRWPAVFVEWAHDVAAIAMFAAIIAVVAHYAWYSARRPKRPGAGPRKITQAYVVIVGVMTIALVAAALLQPGGVVLIVEAILVTGFAAFWCVQTVDLWDNEDKYCRIGHTGSSRFQLPPPGAVG